MRFCPFCSAENLVDATHCQECARKLPPLPPRRRAKSANGHERDAKPQATARIPTPEPPPIPLAAVPPPSRAERDRQATADADNDRLLDPARLDAVMARAATPTPAPAAVEPVAAELAPEPALEPEPEPEPAPAPAAELAPEPEPEPEPEPAPAAALAPEPEPELEPAPRLAPEPDPESERPAPKSKRDRTDTGQPPPTRLAVRAERDAIAHRPMAVMAIPEIPEPGLVGSARYTIAFARARWQRRQAVTRLRELIALDTGGLDEVLGRLGSLARDLEVRTPVLTAENDAIDAAEKRRQRAEHDCAELSARQAEENAKFAEIEAERLAKVGDAEKELEAAQGEHASHEAQRRALRDKRKAVEKRQKGYLKAADDREAQADKTAMADQAEVLRTTAKNLRRDAANLDPERQDIERRIAALDKPISQALARVEAGKAELESAKASLNDARQGHKLRLTELEAELGRKTREVGQAEAEIQRRLITLGTLINLNRIERPEFRQLYDEIDRLRGAIGSRSNEIDRLTAEREAYDKPTIVRGSLALGGAGLIVITLLLILFAAL